MGLAAWRVAYFTIIGITHLSFAAVFLFLHLHRRSKFLRYFAVAWIIEALRVSLHVARSRGVEVSDRWFALQDIAYLFVSWLLLSASAHFVGRRRFPRLWPLLYFGLSISLILGNYFLLRPAFVHRPGQSGQPNVFYPVLANMLVVFIPGAAARIWPAAWFFSYWKRTRLPGALVIVFFFILHGLGSLWVPLQWYFSYFPPGSYLTWFFEIIGLSIGVVMLASNKQHAELLLAERKYELFFDRLTDGALVFDSQEICTVANPAARARLGLSSGARLRLRDLFCDEERYWEFREQALQPAGGKIETNLRPPTGEPFPASVSGGLYYGLDRQPSAYFLTFDDITEQTRAHEERSVLLAREQDARLQAEHASRLKDEFLATVSHELRTPLTAILGWARLLESGTLEESTRTDAVRIIVRNARAQAQLIEDILDVSRIITGRMRLNPQKVDLALLADAVIESLRPSADAKRISLAKDFGPRAEVLRGDPQRLQQVVWNLLSNAIKFTPNGGAVEIRLDRVDAQVQIAVSDTGQGIRPDFLPHVFDRFRQADGSFQRVHGGLGLGLAIVRHLVELHGGSVAVDSPGVGKGATFTIALPAEPSSTRVAIGSPEAGIIQIA